MWGRETVPPPTIVTRQRWRLFLLVRTGVSPVLPYIVKFSTTLPPAVTVAVPVRVINPLLDTVTV